MTLAAATEVIPVGPVASLVKAVSALIGGVVGIYLIILYLRWKEYLMMKRMLLAIRKDLRVFADEQGVSLPAIKEPKLFSIRNFFRRKINKYRMKRDLEKQHGD